MTIRAGLALSMLLLAISIRGQQVRGTTVDGQMGQPGGGARSGTYYALVIGINQYRSPLPTLKTAVHDAEEMAKDLRQRYGFEVRLLTDGEATRDNILGAMDVYRRSLHDGDSLMVYYAGHGYADTDEDKSYWLPVDADRDSSSHWISADDLTNRMRADPARHVLIISDSCYSGGLTREGGIELRPADQQTYLRKMGLGRSRTLMSSGGNEPVADGGADGHSVFANAVLKALEATEAREFTAGDLFHDFVLRQVTGRSDQVPRYSNIRNSGDDAGDFIFRRIEVAGKQVIESAGADGAAPASDIQLQAELMVWTSVKDLKQAALLQDYLRQYPNGRFSAVARAMLEGLKAGETTAGDGVPRVVSPNTAAGLSAAKRGIALFEANQFRDALPLLQTAAQQGDADAEAFVCRMYSKGWGVERDYSLALKLCGSSAKKGNAYGEAFLGVMYGLGQGTAKDFPAAFRLGQQSAKQGNAYGLNLLGAIYSGGLGITKDELEAVKYFRESADQGNAYGSANLGESFLYGNGVQKDESEALRRCRPTAEAGNEVGAMCLGLIYDGGLGTAKDPTEAVKWYRKAAELGNVGGQVNLGFAYQAGDGVPKDTVLAVLWYRKAADQGDPGGETSLGTCYANGTGVAKDLNEAVKWYRKAADKDYTSAEVYLGLMYETGQGVAKDEKEAVRLYRKAADQGDPSAQANLGVKYGAGLGVAQDYAEAVKWYRKSAEQGNPGGERNLGVMYEYGTGVPQDKAVALQWYLKSAEHGDATGQVYAAIQYRDGNGTAKDPAAAIKWFRRGADQGNVQGEYCLARMYDDGDGVSKNPGLALYWYEKAALQEGSLAESSKTAAEMLRKKKVVPVDPGPSGD